MVKFGWVLECLGAMYFLISFYLSHKVIKPFCTSAALLVIGILCFLNSLYISAVVLIAMGSLFLSVLTLL